MSLLIHQSLVVQANNTGTTTGHGKIVELPVWYDTECGPELSLISEHSGLSINEVITLHHSGLYRVYAIGFAPGFAFLGDVDERIAMQRLSTPRQKVPAGSLGIANRQTAVYPSESPGGWNLIGRCPTRIFNPAAEPPMPIRIGDSVRFMPIDKTRYLQLGGVI